MKIVLPDRGGRVVPGGGGRDGRAWR